jgi:hypothetical protein
MLKTRTSAFFSLLLVFLSGALMGVVGERLYNTATVSSRVKPAVKSEEKRPDPEERRRAIIEDNRKRLKLDDQQVQQLQLIFDNTREQFMKAHDRWDTAVQALRDSQRDAIRHILRSDQVPLYEKLIKEHDAERMKKQASKGTAPGPAGERK